MAKLCRGCAGTLLGQSVDDGDERAGRGSGGLVARVRYDSYRKEELGRTTLGYEVGKCSVTSVYRVRLALLQRILARVASRAINLLIRAVLRKLSQVVRVKLPCLRLGQRAPSLSNKRTRELGLIQCVKDDLAKVACVFSRPDTKVRPQSICHVGRLLGGLQSGKGAILIIRRSGSMVSVTSRIVSIKPTTKRGNNRVIFRKDCPRLLEASALAKGSVRGLFPVGRAPHGTANDLPMESTYLRGLGRISISVPLKIVAIIANITNSKGDALVSRMFTETCRGRIIVISRKPVATADHSAPTSCLNFFSRVQGLLTQRGGRPRDLFDFGSTKTYPVYNNGNILIARLTFVSPVIARYRTYNNIQCGERTLTYACGKEGVIRLLKLATSRTLRLFRSAEVEGHLDMVRRIKLSCLALKRPLDALSKKRQRQVGLTGGLKGDNDVVIVSRPAANLRESSMSGLLGLFSKVMSDKGALMIVRRGLSIVGRTS